MPRYIDADALKKRLIKRRDEIAEERKYGWEWEYNGFNGAVLLTGCEAVQNPVNPKFQWVPVTERLPEKPGKYLVTVRNGNVYAGTFDKISNRFQCAATAWMPLPEPYEEERT